MSCHDFTDLSTASISGGEKEKVIGKGERKQKMKNIGVGKEVPLVLVIVKVKNKKYNNKHSLIWIF